MIIPRRAPTMPTNISVTWQKRPQAPQQLQAISHPCRHVYTNSIERQNATNITQSTSFFTTSRSRRGFLFPSPFRLQSKLRWDQLGSPWWFAIVTFHSPFNLNNHKILYRGPVASDFFGGGDKDNLGQESFGRRMGNVVGHPKNVRVWAVVATILENTLLSTSPKTKQHQPHQAQHLATLFA